MARQAPPRLTTLLARLTLIPSVALGIGLGVVWALGPTHRAGALTGAICLALGTAWFVARRAQLLWEASTEALDRGLEALAQGRFSEVGGREGLLLDGSVGRVASTAAAVEGREAAVRSFGAEADAARAKDWLGVLQSPPREAVVGVLTVHWRDVGGSTAALAAPARLSALSRYYECVLDSVGTEGAAVLELGGGAVVAVWGAPEDAGADGPDPQAVLRAGWRVRLRLEVLANQLKLRQGLRLDWGCGAAWGPAVSGAWGPAMRRRWTLVGEPLERARSLATRAGGPWLDAELVPSAVPPYRAEAGVGASLLFGPEYL